MSREGAPERPNYYPGICDLYVDVRMPPKTSPVDMQHQRSALLAGLDMDRQVLAAIAVHAPEAFKALVETASKAAEAKA